MPTYQFRCREHPEQQVEEYWSLSDIEGSALPDPCPVCQVPMSRVFTAPAVHFRGGGWGGSST